MAYIGVQPTDTYLSIASQQITGTGSATYTLDYSVSNEEDVAVFVNNVRQNVSSYTVSGDQLTLGGTISASDECWVLFLGRTVGTKTPAVGSVTNDMLAGSIANAKLANSSITLNGSAVSLGGSASVNGIFETQLLHVRDEKATGSHGGTASALTDNVRVLNTVVTNEITGASLGSNRITLPAGTYFIDAWAYAYSIDMHRAMLYNQSDSSVTILGHSSFANDTTQGYAPSFVRGRFTISAQKLFEIRHYTEKTGSGVDLGVDTNDSRTNVYTDVQIWKVA